jgi:hypothetical protein
LFSLGYAGYSEFVRISKQRHESLIGLLTGSKDSFHLPMFMMESDALDIHTPGGVLLQDSNGDSLLSLRIDDRGRLLTSARVSDSNGNLIAEIRDNEWQHQPRPVIWDRNYNDHVLEVLDSHGDVALQVVDLGDYVSIKGVFACSSGQLRVLNTDINGNLGMTIVPKGFPTRGLWKIYPVCKYPGENHLGECPGADTITSDGIVKHLGFWTPIRC